MQAALADAREEAAAFPLVFETAYRMLVTRARLQEGEWVFTWGIGSGVSTAVLAIAKALGAQVTAVCAAAKSDAVRAPAEGETIVLPSKQPWRVPGRQECMFCHSRAAGFLLGVSTPQLNRPGRDGDNQLVRWERMGLLKFNHAAKEEGEWRWEFGKKELPDAELQAKPTLFRAVGCPRCNGGYAGRFAILETLPIKEDIKRLIVEGRSALGSWIYRITTNTALNKRRGKRGELEESLEEHLPTFLADGHRAGDRRRRRFAQLRAFR